MHQQAKAVSFTTCKSQHKTNYCKNTSVVSTCPAPIFAGPQEQGNAVPFLATNSLGGARVRPAAAVGVGVGMASTTRAGGFELRCM